MEKVEPASNSIEVLKIFFGVILVMIGFYMAVMTFTFHNIYNIIILVGGAFTLNWAGIYIILAGIRGINKIRKEKKT